LRIADLGRRIEIRIPQSETILVIVAFVSGRSGRAKVAAMQPRRLPMETANAFNLRFQI